MSPRGSKESTPTPPPSSEGDSTTQEHGPRVSRTLYIGENLLNRARAASTHLSAYEPDAGIHSLSDLVERGLAVEVRRVEDEYNDGQPFRPVNVMPAGRPVRRPTKRSD